MKRHGRYFGDTHWNEPLTWNRAAEHAKQRKRVFCMSMGDWRRPTRATPSPRAVVGVNPAHAVARLLMLTKRPQLIPALYPHRGNATRFKCVARHDAETQAWLDLRWPLLKRAPAAVYWLSIERSWSRSRYPKIPCPRSPSVVHRGR